MELNFENLRKLWQQMSGRAHDLILRGITTLSDGQFITNRPKMDDANLKRWLEKNRAPRHAWLARLQPWVDHGLESLDDIVIELEALWHLSRCAVRAFLDGKLTLAQTRYAASVRMGSRSLRYFTDLNDRLAVRERRAARREFVANKLFRRADEALELSIRLGRMTSETAEALRRNQTPPEGILVYVQARAANAGRRALPALAGI